MKTPWNNITIRFKYSTIRNWHCTYKKAADKMGLWEQKIFDSLIFILTGGIQNGIRNT